VLRRGTLLEWDGPEEHAIVEVADLPVALGGLARHNVANALAAAGGARAMGATCEEIADGLRHFRPSADLSPGRLNLFRLGHRTVIVDFAHNEAGTTAILDVAAGIAGGAAGRAAPVTAIIGTAGDRPDDTLRGIGRIAAERAQRVVIKETPMYLRGRAREDVVGTILEGVAEAGVDPSTIPVYGGEAEALEAELTGTGAATSGNGRADAPRVVILFCHAERDQVFSLLERLGARQLDAADSLAELAPRVADRRRS
jgi:cyanophycin synthetase